MSKKDLINAVVKKTDGKHTKTDIDVIIEALGSAIAELLVVHKKVKLPNIGTFIVRERKKRMVKNPKNQKMTEIPAKNAAAFKPSSALSEYIMAKCKVKH